MRVQKKRMGLKEKLKERVEELHQRRTARSRSEAREAGRRATTDRIRVAEKVLGEIRAKLKKEMDPRKREVMEAKAREMAAYLEAEKMNASGTKYRTAVSKQP